MSLKQVLEMDVGMGTEDKHLWEHSKLVRSDLLRGEQGQLLRWGHQMAVVLLPSTLPSSPAEPHR